MKSVLERSHFHVENRLRPSVETGGSLRKLQQYYTQRQKPEGSREGGSSGQIVDVLKVEPTGFPDRLDTGSKKKGRKNDDSGFGRIGLQ